jgi:hypothetical protein
MRASAGGVQTPRAELLKMRRLVESRGLYVSMVTADFDVPLNNEAGPSSLRDIGPSLDVADAFGCDLLRVALKTEADIDAARQAADIAAARGIRLVHQCHNNSAFEQVGQILANLKAIGRPNFGVTFEPANLLLCGEDYGERTLQLLAPHMMNAYIQNHAMVPDAEAARADGTYRYQTLDNRDVPYNDLLLWEAGGVGIEGAAVPTPPLFSCIGNPAAKKRKERMSIPMMTVENYSIAIAHYCPGRHGVGLRRAAGHRMDGRPSDEGRAVIPPSPGFRVS